MLVIDNQTCPTCDGECIMKFVGECCDCDATGLVSIIRKKMLTKEAKDNEEFMRKIMEYASSDLDIIGLRATVTELLQ
jgi:hypothetical protein